MDLPGAYSLSAYSPEEVVARNVLLGGAVQAVINVVDAGILERGLLLTAQLREMGLPVIIACNMMDEARAAGISIDFLRLTELMGAIALLRATACARPFPQRVRPRWIPKTTGGLLAASSPRCMVSAVRPCTSATAHCSIPFWKPCKTA